MEKLMTIDYQINEYNVRHNIRNIRDFNYIAFSDEQWTKVSSKFGKRLPKNYSKNHYKIVVEATKVNPIVKLYYNAKTSEEYICIKLTPFEVMVSNNSDTIFKYNKLLTHDWHDILESVFGESYIQAKNKHYGIKPIEK